MEQITVDSTSKMPIPVLSTGQAMHISIRSLQPGDDSTNNVKVVEQGRFTLQAIAASQTDKLCGAVGAVGDFLHRIIITVNTALTGTVAIADGNGADIQISPASGSVGVFSVKINATSVNATTPGWKVTTGAGATVVPVGRFS